MQLRISFLSGITILFCILLIGNKIITYLCSITKQHNKVMANMVVEKVWLTDTEVWIRTADGREACEKFTEFPRLRFATPEQRAAFTLSKEGIHWEEIDEDLSFEGFFMQKPSNPLYDVFIAHPELNASAIARRLGISQSLFAQYVSGTKKPSAERLETIFETIRSVGKELCEVSVA